MTTRDASNHEMLSALFDGQPGSEVALADLYSPSAGNIHSNWNAYHLIGNCLRAPESFMSHLPAAASGADPAFLQRLSARLAHESVEQPAPQRVPSALDVVVASPVAAANDGQFRWKMVAAFASMAAVLAVAWSLVGTTPASSLPQLAQDGAGQTTSVVTASPAGPMIRDARLEELLSAHKQLGATSLQVPSGFVRNASLETSGPSGR